MSAPSSSGRPIRSSGVSRLRHTIRLLRDLASVSSQSGLWWLLPLTAVALLLAVLAASAQVVVPYSVYTFF